MCLQRSSKKSNESPGHRSPGGRSFHSRRPAAEKRLSPSLLCVLGTSSFRMSLEWDLAQRATTSVRQKMTVVSKIRRSSTSERLMLMEMLCLAWCLCFITASYHPQMLLVMCSVGHFCLSVCLSRLFSNFFKPWPKYFSFDMQIHLGDGKNRFVRPDRFD